MGSHMWQVMFWAPSLHICNFCNPYVIPGSDLTSTRHSGGTLGGQVVFQVFRWHLGTSGSQVNTDATATDPGELLDR